MKNLQIMTPSEYLKFTTGARPKKMDLTMNDLYDMQDKGTLTENNWDYPLEELPDRILENPKDYHLKYAIVQDKTGIIRIWEL